MAHKHYVIIIDKEKSRMKTKAGLDLDDSGDIKLSAPDSYTITKSPESVSIEYYKSFDKVADMESSLTLTETDMEEMIVLNMWGIEIQTTSEPPS